MAGLQRSAQTFRRSGSSGLVWDERFLTQGAEEEKPNDGGGTVRQPELRHSRSVGSVGMLRRRSRDDAAGNVDDKRKLVIKPKAQKDHPHNQEERVQASGRKAFRTRDVASAAEPPSPRVSGCVLCSIFRSTVPGRGQWRGSSAQRARPGKQ